MRKAVGFFAILLLAFVFLYPGAMAQPQTGASPITLTAFTDQLVSHNTTTVSTGVVQFPNGSFSKIVLYYENVYKSNPWDYSYAIVLNGVQVASGNTYEMENTTVSENITEYYSVIVGKTVTVQAFTAEWEPGYAAYQSVWFVLYPGNEPKNIPNYVVSIRPNNGFYTPKNAFPNNVLIPFNVSQTFNVTFPENTTGGYLNLYMLQNGNDEGWYANQPPFREFIISVNSTVVARIWPYPNIQTGGWNLFNWQPIHAIGALLDKPYVANLNIYASILRGQKQVNITVLNDEDQWIRPALNFMLYTGQPTKMEFNSTWTINNSYVQIPATNMTTESIPSNATWLNDSQVVHEIGTSWAMGGGNIYYLNISNYVNAKSKMYDPSFNIVQPYGNQLLIPFYQDFSYMDEINASYTVHYGGNGTFEKIDTKDIYTVAMNFTYDIIIYSNGTVAGIIVGDQLSQSRFIQSSVTIVNASNFYVNTSLNYSIVTGSGGFEGIINNGVIVNLTYNHAYTMRTNEYYYAEISNGQHRYWGFLQILIATNNSTTVRNGILVYSNIIYY